MMIILSICIVLTFYLIYLFLKKYIFDRKFSLQKGIDLIINLLKNHSIPIVFILDSENQTNELLICLKSSLKKRGLNYVNINDSLTFHHFYKIYNRFFNNKLIIFSIIFNHKLIKKYMLKDKNNIIVFNLYYYDLVKPIGKNITHCNHLIDRIKLIFNMKDNLNIISIPDYLVYNELNLAYKMNLINKTNKNLILNNNLDLKKILIPKEYFLIDDPINYLKIKSNTEDIYIWKKNNIIDKFLKIFYLNRVFSGINDSYDFYPSYHNYIDFQNDQKLNKFIQELEKLKIIISPKVIITNELAMILQELNILFNITIYYQKNNNNLKLKINQINNYFILIDFFDLDIKYKNFENENNIYLINHLNYQSIFNYIYSRILQININNFKKVQFFKLKDDLLLISDHKISNDKIKNYDLNKIVWVENIHYINVDIINYINLIHLRYNNICIHLILDHKTYYNIKLFLLLKKLKIKFIAYIKKRFDKNEYLQDFGFNIINLKDKKSSFYQNKEIIKLKGNLIIFSE